MSVITDLTALYRKLQEARKEEDLDLAATLEAEYRQEVDALPLVTLGNTWLTNPDGSWFLPEHTLGWEIAGWCTEYLRAKDGSPWNFTDEQLRLLLWWYALDENGEFIYRTGVIQRSKGWGKDPLLAVICLVEFVGPSRFSHWDEAGEPVGKAVDDAWVQVAAVSRDQTVNTVALFPSLMTDELISKYGITPGIELIRAHGGKSRLEAVTSSYRALEGKRTTFVVLNETHHWVSGNNGHKMYETVDGNATKMNARYLAITNAYLPGEDSAAERQREAYEKVGQDQAVDVGVMYDSLEAHSTAPLTPEALEILLPKIRGDSWWLNVKATIKSVMNGTIAPSRSRRMYLNQIVAEEDAIYSKAQWDTLEVNDSLRPKDKIVLGFDGGKTDDATALVAIRVADNFVQPIGIWQKPDGPRGDGWEINRELVDSTVHEAFALYDVQGMYCDVYLWESYIADWNTRYGEGLAVKASQNGEALSWDMRQGGGRGDNKVALAHERLVRSIFDEKLKHAGQQTELSSLLRNHVGNTRRRITNQGLLSFGKESPQSPRKVDAYAAMMLAHECLYDLRNRGKAVKKASGRVWFM